MAMDKDALGAAIAARVTGFAPNNAMITGAELIQIWQDISEEIINHIAANADITLGAADITTQVPALGLFENLPVPGPITGLAAGSNDAVVLSTKIS